MRTRCGRALLIGLAVAVLLGGCATTTARQESMGISTAENPEYLAHPFRLTALGLYLAGNILQYAVIEPFYFVMNTIPDAVGLEADEQQYIEARRQAWAQWMEPR
jgi:hypothetical protein